MGFNNRYHAQISRNVLGKNYTENGNIILGDINFASGINGKTLSGVVGYENIGGILVPKTPTNPTEVRFFGDISGSVSFYSLRRRDEDCKDSVFEGVRVESDTITELYRSFDIHSEEIDIEALIAFYNLVATGSETLLHTRRIKSPAELRLTRNQTPFH